MNKVVQIVIVVISGVVGWCFGKGVGIMLYSTYEETGNLITAKDSIELHYLTPLVFSLIFAYVAYFLTRNND